MVDETMTELTGTDKARAALHSAAAQKNNIVNEHAIKISELASIRHEIRETLAHLGRAGDEITVKTERQARAKLNKTMQQVI